MLDRTRLHSPDDGLNATARELLLDVLRDELGVDANEIMDCYLRNEGMRDIYELDQKLGRIGTPLMPRLEADATESKLARVTAGVVAGGFAIGMVTDPTRQLQQLPDREFLAAIEHTLQDLKVPPLRVDAGALLAAARDRIAHLFRVRLLPYSIDENAIITWAGEPALHELAIGPALAALADPRLAAARDEFEQARRELRLGELDDAANDAGCAVESTMAALLHAHGRRQPTKHGKERVQAGPLFDALEAAALLDRERDRHLIFAPIAVRDPGSHGAGVKPRRLDPAYVEGGIAAAAVAIAYLASKLP